MGLDQYVQRITKKTEQLYFWRKFGELQNLLCEVYQRETGNTDDFNCQELTLTEAICDEVITALTTWSMPDHQGFFFDQSNAKDKEFIDDAIEKWKQIKTEVQNVSSDEEIIYFAWY